MTGADRTPLLRPRPGDDGLDLALVVADLREVSRDLVASDRQAAARRLERGCRMLERVAHRLGAGLEGCET